MEEEIEKQTCELCGNKGWVLYPIIYGRDNFLAPRRGVCKKCFDKSEDLDREIILKSKRVIEENIRKSKDNLEFWEEELKKVEEK